MQKSDMFGLERERRILQSGVRKIFTPHKPINSIELFLGRQREIQQIIEQINTPGQHSLLYGDRGVGKSSLANVASALLLKNLVKGKLYSKKCDSNETLTSIFREPLLASGVDPMVVESTSSLEQEGKAGAKIPGFSSSVGSKRSTSKKRLFAPLTPSSIAEAVGKLSGLFVIDEVDVISENTTRKGLAEVIKHLSDMDSQFKILVVGIADTGAELTAKHPSVHRCLKETKLDRMSSEELIDIVTRGAARLKLTFDPAVTLHIASVSAGYPHFAHLLALKCAESAIATGNNRVSATDLLRATDDATKDAEGTLKRIYDDTIRSASNSEYFKKILMASASMPHHEFSAKALRDRLSQITGRPVTQGSLNNYLRKLVSDDGETVLKRKAKGVYAFNDPRMPSFIRIANRNLG
jgi:Cdc6-like AAA superfamily ATPase